MPTFYITPPSARTNGETAYFLTTFINRQHIAPELEAVCHSGELQIATAEGIAYQDIEKVVAAYAEEVKQDGGTADQIEEAEDLRNNLDVYLREG